MRVSVAFKALLAQTGAVLLAVLAFKVGPFFGLDPGLGSLVALQSALAVLLSGLFRLPWWWLIIQGFFIPGVFFTSSLKVPPGFFLAGFILLCLFYSSNIRERVPLYLSNETTGRALGELLPKQQVFSFLDLGSGFGGILAYLAERNSIGTFQGIESAPALFLISWLRLRKRFNANVRYGNLWRENLESYDVVYAFLSPAAMPELWRKAKKEMRQGSLFVSNSFIVPGEKPTRTLRLKDARRTRLLVWKM
jgi:hypothetical protein